MNAANSCVIYSLAGGIGTRANENFSVKCYYLQLSNLFVGGNSAKLHACLAEKDWNVLCENVCSETGDGSTREERSRLDGSPNLEEGPQWLLLSHTRPQL